MSVVGFDFGNVNCLVAVARQRGIDVVLNDESNRETPAIVCFGEKQRFIGTAGAASTMMNPKKSLIGKNRRFLQTEGNLFVAAKSFAAGVILATGFVHMVAGGTEGELSLASEVFTIKSVETRSDHLA